MKQGAENRNDNRRRAHPSLRHKPQIREHEAKLEAENAGDVASGKARVSNMHALFVVGYCLCHSTDCVGLGSGKEVADAHNGAPMNCS